MKPQRPWSNIPLLLHSSFALAIVIQMLTSLFMKRPYLGRFISNWQYFGFKIHEYSGLFAAACILLYWVWILKYDCRKLHHLFPYNTQGLADIITDTKQLCSLQLPEVRPAGGLAGLIHGLGLCLVSLVAFWGVILFFGLPDVKQILEPIYSIKHYHSFWAYWIWWYLAGHAGMAIWHRVQNH